MTGTNGKRNGGNWFDVEIVYESFEGMRVELVRKQMVLATFSLTRLDKSHRQDRRWLESSERITTSPQLNWIVPKP